MALTRLTNLIASRNGRMIYVNPDDFNATDLISNTGNSPSRPFKTLQRALLEVARFSYVAGLNNDKYDQFTIMLSPGDYIIDNRPGLATAAACPELSDQSNFNILDPSNDLYKFNSIEGGLVIPRGTSIVGMDLRKTRVRPRYVPQPDDPALSPTSIFKVTGACYFWQFSLFDALQLGDTSGLGGVYRQPNSNTLVNPDFSHHKVTCFTYADNNDLNLFYEKAAKAFANIPDTTGELFSRIQENRIVGPLQQAGQKSIGALSVVGSTATFTSIGNHELFVGQQVTIEGVTGTYSAINDTYYIAETPNDTTFVITSASFTALPVGSSTSGELTNAIVKAEIDTVDSASPYVFNCSLRSTYGLCGLWADGSKVTGFKSMVVAQFTGVSLQKDDNAFIKFTETTNPPSFVLNGAAADASSLHQDASGFVFYREDWRHYHIRVSNNAFIQSVSVFAVGYAEQHLIESGGDYSITNSNSNFGTNALIADGFRPDAFALDKKGYISHIVPPQSLLSVEFNIPYYPLDVQKSRDGVPSDSTGSRIYLYDQVNPDITPAFNINQQKIGGKTNDKLFVKLSNPSNGSIAEYEAVINPNGIEERIVSTINLADNIFTTSTLNNFDTGTPIRIYSSTGYLPLGMESNKLYYAVKVDSSRFKIAPTEEDARAAAGGSLTSVVNIRSAIPLNATLTVKSYVSDTNPNLPAFDVSVDPSDTPSGNSFSTGTYNHGFSTGDIVFLQRRRDSTGTSVTGTLPLIQSGGTTVSLNLAQLYYVIVVNSTTFKIATTSSNAIAGNNILIDSTGDANVLRVYRDIVKSPLRFDPSYVTSTTTVKGWYVSVNAVGNTIHPVFTSSDVNNIYSNVTVINTQNSYIKRIPDNRRNPDRTYRLRYVIPKTDTNSRPPILGYVIKRKTDSSDTIIAHESATNAAGVTSTTNDFERVYYIYKIDTVLPHIPNEQDGVYYLTVLLADIAPKGSQFGTVTNTFNYLKYSQDVSKIYPELDKDNPIADPSSSTSVADNLIQGLVYQDDNKKSVTKEAIETFLSETGYTPTLSSLTGLATSGQENRLIAFSPAAPQIQVELRRTSQIRAGNQTFEYTGFNSGNYSTGFPSKQVKVLGDKEVLYSQAQRRRAGIVFYSGLNAYGDLYVGNQKINSVTGEVEILDQPVLTVAGSTARSTQQFIPYASDGRSADLDGAIYTRGDSDSGSGTLSNSFNNFTNINEGTAIKANTTTGRGLLTEDLVLRPKTGNPLNTPSNGNIKQIGLSTYTSIPTPTDPPGRFLGDLYYKPTITSTTRHEGYIYTGQSINSGWAQIGLVGVGHLTSIEDSSAAVSGATVTTPEYYDTTGRFGINKTNPSASLHVGTGDSIFDNDVAINGGDLTSTSSTFNVLNQPITVNAFTAATTADILTSATDIDLGASTGTLKVHNAIADFDGDVNIDGGDLTTNLASFNLLNQPTTIDAFAAATRVNIGAATGQTVVRNNLSVVGNLFINGTTTTIESTTATVKDPVLSLGGEYVSTISGVAGAISGVTIPGAVPGDTKDRGLELTYVASGVTRTGFIGWDTSAEKYTVLKEATNANDVFSGSDAEMQVGKITVTDATTGWNYTNDPFANFAAGTYTAASNTDVNANFRRLIEKYATPVGTIIMWSGSVATIPAGWCLCDGTNRTDRNGAAATVPDLRDRFVVGVGTTYTPNNTGGVVSNTLSTATSNIAVSGDTANQTFNISSNTGDGGDHSHGGNTGGHRLRRREIPPHVHGMQHVHDLWNTRRIDLNRTTTADFNVWTDDNTTLSESSGSGGTNGDVLNSPPSDPTGGANPWAKLTEFGETANDAVRYRYVSNPRPNEDPNNGEYKNRIGGASGIDIFTGTATARSQKASGNNVTGPSNDTANTIMNDLGESQSANAPASEHSHTIGGSGNHNHPISLNNVGSHLHSINIASTGNHAHNLSLNSAAAAASVTIDNLPPYYALCYIYKL